MYNNTQREQVVLAGISGSEKSSLTFDVIAVECNRLVVDQKMLGDDCFSTVSMAMDVASLLRLLFSHVGQSSVGNSMAYSQWNPTGMCPSCGGLGTQIELLVDFFSIGEKPAGG